MQDNPKDVGPCDQVISSNFIINLIEQLLRNDDGCEEVYNRTTVFCYTKMPKEQLWKYVKGLELLADGEFIQMEIKKITCF